MTTIAEARATPADGRLAVIAEALVASLLAFVLYWVTGPPVDGDMWPPLAEAFLSGQLHLAADRPWLELVPRPDGGQYVPLPPVPALTLVPLALVTGPETPWGEVDGNVYASIVGALNVLLVALLLHGWGVAAAPRRWLTVAFAMTTHWWVAGMAGPHHYAEICGVFFALAALNLAVRGRSPLGTGLLLGLAGGSRLPVGLALPALLAIVGRTPDGRWRADRRLVLVLIGVAIPAIALAGYNIARFGSPIDFGYAHIPSGDTGLITDEPWFSEGLFHPSYIPRHLNVIFLEGFRIVDEAPYLRPSLTGMSLLLTAPYLFLSVLARGRLVPWLWLGVILVLLPDLMWGTWGFAQFGYRRILDALPLLLLLLGTAYRERVDLKLRALVVVGVVVHAYGIWVVNVYGFVP